MSMSSKIHTSTHRVHKRLKGKSMSNNRSLKEFYELTDAEEYFEFFVMEYDVQLVNVK